MVNNMINNLNDNMDSLLALNAFDSIPTPGKNARDITGLVKERGKVTGYQLSDGEFLSKERAVDLAKAGGINNVGVAHRGDAEYLKSLPDENDHNNLSDLPTVK